MEYRCSKCIRLCPSFSFNSRDSFGKTFSLTSSFSYEGVETLKTLLEIQWYDFKHIRKLSNYASETSAVKQIVVYIWNVGMNKTLLGTRNSKTPSIFEGIP